VAGSAEVAGPAGRPFVLGGASDWPQIAGIDPGLSERRMGGDRELLARLIEKLLELDEALAAQETTPAADEEEATAQLAAVLHKLKGSSGMLGASALQQQAGSAEAEARAGRLAPARAGLGQLRAGLAQLRASSAAFLAEMAARAAARDEAQAGAGAVELGGEDITRLLRQLRYNDLAALDHFERLAPALRARMGELPWRSMRDHINNLRFDEAAALLAGSAPVAS